MGEKRDLALFFQHRVEKNGFITSAKQIAKKKKSRHRQKKIVDIFVPPHFDFITQSLIKHFFHDMDMCKSRGGNNELQ